MINADLYPMLPRPQALPAGQNYQNILWLFRGESQIAFKPKRRNLRYVSNLINYLHFSNNQFLLHFADRPGLEDELVAATPEPCENGTFSCRLENTSILENNRSLQPRHILIEDGKHVLVALVALVSIENDSVVLSLEGNAFVLGRRQMRRFRATRIDARIAIGRSAYAGTLLDFNRGAYHIELKNGAIDGELVNGMPLSLTLLKDNVVILETACTLIREWQRFGKTGLVAEPSRQAASRFKKRLIRNPRVRLDPAPAISFVHPVSGKSVQIYACEISSSGFSVRESKDEAVLVPGMIIPDLRIHLPGSDPIQCAVQVIYEHEEEADNAICFGLSILDIDLQGYSKLSQVICRAMDKHSFISEGADPEALWDLFFGTGFIYPEKYAYMQGQRKRFLETYEKILNRNPRISKYFVFQEHGRILAHIGLIHAYHRAWMVHHHAARTSENPRGGLMVLKHAMYFLNDMHRFPSLKIDYAVCYYRPDNRFPKQVFGGFAETLNNRQGCSQDQWAYMILRKRPIDGSMPDGWHLVELSEADKAEADKWYNERSGGLMISALGLARPEKAQAGLEMLYSQSGIKRKISLFALKYAGQLVAVFILNHADPGLNFSGFLNCIQILTIREELADWSILEKIARNLMAHYEEYVLPILCFPASWAQKAHVPFDKTYIFWVLNLPSYGDRFMDYTNGKFKL